MEQVLDQPQEARRLPQAGLPGRNWRDIFQNWEPLAWSYPEFVEGMISVFVNAMTADGYNPYRVTRDGIVEWEALSPEDPLGQHRLLERSPDHLPAEAAGDLGRLPPGQARGPAGATDLQPRQRPLSHQALCRAG